MRNAAAALAPPAPSGDREPSRSLVWNKCTAHPATAASVRSSGENETCDAPRSGTRVKSSPGTICSAGSFSLRDSHTSASLAVWATHKPAWSARTVSPYRELTATSLA